METDKTKDGIIRELSYAIIHLIQGNTRTTIRWTEWALRDLLEIEKKEVFKIK